MAITERTSWQQLQALKPALARHTDIQRRHYQNELWYLLHDKASGRFHRFSPSAYQVLQLMDGKRNLEKIYTQAQTLPHTDNDKPASQNEIVELMQYLHVADLLVCDLPANSAELFARQQKKQQQKWSALLMNPLIWRIPLGNPNPWVSKLLPLAKLLRQPSMGIIWLIVVSSALIQTWLNWDTISNHNLDNLMSAQNLILLWLTYPLLKILHELGHALFTKAWGGQVNECGIVFVMGAPMPYVDATDATAFQKKSQRLMVSAAGMAVELFIAALALFLWLAIEDGLMRSILFNIMVLGSISTLFFNGNPLLRFDGYHLLCDIFDSPNLATRANKQLGYCLQHYGYGVQGLHSPAASRVEAGWLIAYSLAAFVYRFFILLIIIYIAAQYFPTLGMLLGLWLLIFQLLLPLAKKILYLIQSPTLANIRKRAIISTAAATLLFIAFVGFVPLPQNTRAEGILWLPDEARVRAETKGFVSKLAVADGDSVHEGQILLELENPELRAELLMRQATKKEFQARYQQVWRDDRSQAALFVSDISAIEAEIILLKNRLERLQIRSPANGIFRLQLDAPIGSFIPQGEQVAIITDRNNTRVRAALTQDEIGLVRQDSRAITVKLSQQLGLTFKAALAEQVPAATTKLPSPALGAAGGGRLNTLSSDPSGLETDKMVFLVDLRLPNNTIDKLSNNTDPGYGQRVYIRFQHSASPLGTRLYRQLQQQFLQLASR